MADLVRLACFPFLPEVPGVVREEGISLGEVLASTLHAGTRKRAVERVEGALGDGFAPAAIMDERGALRELLSVPVARMVVVALGDRQLVRRYADAEARHLELRLRGATDELPAVAEALTVPLRRSGDGWTIGVPDYLMRAPVTKDHWKMLRRPVERGRVHLSDDDALLLCVEALRRRIETELQEQAALPMPPEAERALEPLVGRLTPALEEAREKWNTGDFGAVQPGLFPPCMTELFAMMQRAENIPHHGRFAFASFMATIGMTAEQIMDYLATTPNFDREKSRYQIEHIAGERSVEAYTPPGCQSMQTNGICPLDKRDGLCAKIKHPLSYYRAKLRFQKEDQEKAAKILEARGPAPAPTPASEQPPRPSPPLGGA